jgi:hypothetical protein
VKPFLFLLSLSMVACSTAPVLPSAAAPASALPYFAPGVITIPEATTYRPTFDPMNQEVIFTAEVGSDYVMARSLMSRSGWLEPEVLPFSGVYSDAEGFLSPDGQTMIFSSKRPLSGTEQKRDYDPWITMRSGDDWSAPRRIDVLSGDTNELYTALASDGTLYFMRAETDGNDLWRAKLVNGAYEAAVKLPSPPNSDNRDAAVYIAPDQSFMLLDSNRPGGLGATDIWISFRKGESWSTPKNLAALPSTLPPTKPRPCSRLT